MAADPDQQERRSRRGVGDRLSPRMFRFFMNRYRPFRGVGGKVVSISDDWRTWRIQCTFNRRTRNYVGTLWGGTMAAAPDPFWMLIFLRLLGRDYVVWDKAATIRFRKPARSHLYATFHVSPEMMDEVKAALETEEKVDRTYLVDLVDADGVVHAELEKVLHFRRKELRS